MKIVAGKAKGRRLKTLEGDATRPTAGKVREALFSMLMGWVPQASWLDLFAGSGAIGLEAASRGAERVVLVERAAPALRVIRENVALLAFEGVEVLPCEVLSGVRRLAGQTFDVVFMDPPYADDPLPVVEAVSQAGLLAPNGRLVVEHKFDRALPEEVAGLKKLRTNRYSEACLSVYAPA